MKTLYLDTNHISTLCRHNSTPSAKSVLGLLKSGRARLCISPWHLYELSNPTFKSRSLVGAFLDHLPLNWAVWTNRLFDLEVRSAFERILTGASTPLVVFHPRIQEVWTVPPNYKAIAPSEMLSQYSSMGIQRARMAELAQYGADMDKLVKDRATALRSPDKPILARLKEMCIHETPNGVILPTPYPAKDFLQQAGGLPAFPAYHVFQALGCTRLADKRFPVDPNSLVDEWHACYSPYATVTVLDRQTVARCRSAKLPHCNRITSRLSDVEELLKLPNQAL